MTEDLNQRRLRMADEFKDILNREDIRACNSGIEGMERRAKQGVFAVCAAVEWFERTRDPEPLIKELYKGNPAITAHPEAGKILALIARQNGKSHAPRYPDDYPVIEKRGQFLKGKGKRTTDERHRLEECICHAVAELLNMGMPLTATSEKRATDSASQAVAEYLGHRYGGGDAIRKIWDERGYEPDVSPMFKPWGFPVEREPTKDEALDHWLSKHLDEPMEK